MRKSPETPTNIQLFDRNDSDAFSPGAAHILWHGLPMDLEIDALSSLLVVTYPISWLRSLWPESIATRLDDIVTAAETSASSLLRAFRLHRGTTPMRHVRQLHLEAVHRALLASDSKTAKVSEIASEYAFFQFGRFAAVYKRTFGELPSETLRS